MNLWLAILVGIKEIWAHKFRSFLTMLGVILGVASLLSMFSLTAGMARGVRDYITQLGGIELVGVIKQEVPPEQDYKSEISPGRTVEDAIVIAKIPHLVSRVSPVVNISVNVVAGGNNFRNEAQAVWPDYMPINKHAVAFGRDLTWLDVDQSAHVCVVGRMVVDKLWPEWPDYNAVGETVLINQRPFRIVGIFELYEREEDKRRREMGITTGASTSSSGKVRSSSSSARSRYSSFSRKNGTIVMPISTAFYEFKSANIVAKEDQGPDYRLDSLVFQVADINRFSETLDRVGDMLRITHRGIDDFSFDTREEWFERNEEYIRNVRTSGGLIAGISLLVGGIGITNIMLASITERIREIGVRRAVGAKGRDIFVQIVVESAVVGVIGGLLGLVASLGVMRILVAISPGENAPVLEWDNVIISFSFAVIIGVVSGIYPAVKAARIEPIEALRYG
ncbi:MAG: ABC transporter permease [Chthoniobacteraceae bacterium]